MENTCACVLGSWHWPRAFLSLASRGSVLRRAVLALDFFVPLALASSLVSLLILNCIMLKKKGHMVLKIASKCGVSKGSALRLRLTGSVVQPLVRRREWLIG